MDLALNGVGEIHTFHHYPSSLLHKSIFLFPVNAESEEDDGSLMPFEKPRGDKDVDFFKQAIHQKYFVPPLKKRDIYAFPESAREVCTEMNSPDSICQACSSSTYPWQDAAH